MSVDVLEVNCGARGQKAELRAVITPGSEEVGDWTATVGLSDRDGGEACRGVGGQSVRRTDRQTAGL